MTLFAKISSLGVCCLLIGALFLRGSEVKRTPDGLRCESRLDPLGVDRLHPTLSWTVASEAEGPRQSAYRVLVASTREALEREQGDLWDTGKVEGSDATEVEYQGAPLAAHQHCFWKVMVWNAAGEPEGWSQPGHWSVGILQPDDWQGEWIGYDGPRSMKEEISAAPLHAARWICHADDADGVAPEARRVYRGLWKLPDSIAIPYRAELFLAVDDSCLLAINGIHVAACSDHQQPVRADVGSYVRPGLNEVRAIVTNESSGPTGLCLKLVLTDHRGERYVLTTDERWFSLPHGEADWLSCSFEAAPPVHVVGLFGMRPWGQPVLGRDAVTPPRYLRGGFMIAHPVRQATLYLATLGWADLFLNGHRVNTDFFSSDGTESQKQAHYRAYDVTHQLVQGQNAWGAVLADGWYAGHGWGAKRNMRGKNPRLRAMLRVEFDDGTTQVVSTDQTWFVTQGPKQVADPLIGEDYDATREVPLWAEASFFPQVVAAVDTGAKVPRPIDWHPAPPVVEVAEFPAQTVSQPVPGISVYDIGHHVSGVARLRIQGRRGQRIQIRFGEKLNDDGTLCLTDLRLAQSIDYYTCKGDDVETWQPSQTFRRFRYVELSGVDQPPLDAVTGIALESDKPKQ